MFLPRCMFQQIGCGQYCDHDEMGIIQRIPVITNPNDEENEVNAFVQCDGSFYWVEDAEMVTRVKATYSIEDIKP